MIEATQPAEPKSPRKIKVKWPQLDITITALMKENVNQRLINLLFEHLPYRSLQNHALVSGDHLYHLVPSEGLIVMPDRTTEADGTVFLSGLQHLAIKYGPLSEYLPAAPCGNIIPEDVKKFKIAGSQVWAACTKTKQIIEAIVWDASMPEPSAHLPLRLERIGVNNDMKDLAQRIHDETELSCSRISPDLETVHNGLCHSLAGCKGSCFATMVFINGETRPLGYNILNNILAIAANQPHFDLSHLIPLYRVFATIPAEFVGYTGATFLCSTHGQIDALISARVETNPNTNQARADFLAMISAFARYVNLLNAQNLHLFPWKHAVEYQTQLN
ncbi:cucumopine synthase [Aspergillus ellipticus CBS 707.79]|uniref:Cucumopine synthase n=1 Tax=Aspergillus ellipticus CBS 707.79 TaxID=1448320 RepID=A0A319D6N2_9EURO|nr:cucumopine synthase [Aspergillus ellipticus CBS 707.79]